MLWATGALLLNRALVARCILKLQSALNEIAKGTTPLLGSRKQDSGCMRPDLIYVIVDVGSDGMLTPKILHIALTKCILCTPRGWDRYRQTVMLARTGEAHYKRKREIGSKANSSDSS